MYKCNAVGDNFVKNSVLTMTTYVLWHKIFAPTSQSGVLLFKQLNGQGALPQTQYPDYQSGNRPLNCHPENKWQTSQQSFLHNISSECHDKKQQLKLKSSCGPFQ